ncbi:MAG: hypothetical protein K2L80_02105 [Muribaculaceae bacterium]|nr:hypothetical protein [Muribaculaceae bacterium]
MKKKFILFITLFACWVSAVAQVTIEGDDTEYTDFYAAFMSIDSSEPVTMTLHSDMTTRGALNPAQGGVFRNVTVTSEEGQNFRLSRTGNRFLAQVNTAGSSLAFRNVTLSQTAAVGAATNPAVDVSGKLVLENVTLDGLVNSGGAIINTRNSDNTELQLIDVAARDCVTAAESAVVAVASDNVTVSGDCSLSVYVTAGKSFELKNPAIATPLTLVFDPKAAVGKTIVRGTSEPAYFDVNPVIPAPVYYALQPDADNNALVLIEPAIYNLSQCKNYEESKFVTALAEAVDGDRIIIYKNLSLSGTNNVVSASNVHVSGFDPSVTVNTFNTKTLVQLNAVDLNFTLSSLTLDGGDSERQHALLMASNGNGRLEIRNVTFRNYDLVGGVNCNGLIQTRGTGGVCLSDVKFENCRVGGDARDLVYFGKVNCAVSGNNTGLSVYVEKDVAFNAADLHTTPITVTLAGDYPVGRAFATGNDDNTLFVDSRGICYSAIYGADNEFVGIGVLPVQKPELYQYFWNGTADGFLLPLSEETVLKVPADKLKARDFRDDFMVWVKIKCGSEGTIVYRYTDYSTFDYEAELAGSPALNGIWEAYESGGLLMISRYDGRLQIGLVPLTTVEYSAESDAELTPDPATVTDFKIEDGLMETIITGIDNVQAHDCGSTIEYYNLHGIKVDKDSLVPGVYICRRGQVITGKILVR